MILVTGATQGIGLECARALLARTGLRVLITGRSDAGLARARARIPVSHQPRLLTRVCDQGNQADVEALGHFLACTAAPLDGAILTVGVNPAYAEGPRRIHALTAETIDATIRVNCTHMLLLTTALLARFWRQRAGVLIWVGSQGALAGLRGAGLYGATKSFLSGLAHAAHHEYADRGVRVHLLHPGLVRTPRTAAVADAFASRHGIEVHEAPDVAGSIVSRFLGEVTAAVEINL